MKNSGNKNSNLRSELGIKKRAAGTHYGESPEIGFPLLEARAWTFHEDADGYRPSRHPFDLEERTALFAEAIIRFVRKIPRGPGNDRLIDQIVGCATSVGANYCEANEGVSRKDFRNTIGRCVKEAKETKFFLRMVAAAEPSLAEDARELYREAKELHLIFASIFRKTKP
jgi:four helix bundle protein